MIPNSTANAARSSPIETAIANPAERRKFIGTPMKATKGWPPARRPDRSILLEVIGSDHTRQASRIRGRRIERFEGGGVAEGTANEAQVDVLYPQIGQLKVENDFLARKLGK
jgi:hypothetical protein